MKKIISVLILVAAVCILCTGTAFAATTGADGQTFYIATDDITVYVRSTDGIYQPAFIIPESYYFRTLSQDGEYVSIVYNNNIDYSISLYVRSSDMQSSATVTKDNVTDSNAGYKLNDLQITNKSEILFYAPGNLDKHVATYDFVTEYNSFLGIYQSGNTVYFTEIVTAPTYKVLMFEAKDTNYMSFNRSSIPLHEITIDRNNAENEGVISTPTDGTGETGQNNVIRNVMIAIICIMCVIVIFLIFRPTKNAKNRYEMDNRENADNGKYGDNNRRYDDERYDSGRR